MKISNTSAKQEFSAFPPHFKTASLQQDTVPTDALDGSVAAMLQFLRELVEMTDPGRTVPVLELQFDDVLTATSLSTAHGVACLTMTALLPKHAHDAYLPQSATSPMLTLCCEVLWDAHAGRYVVMRHIPITDLPDERSVMDAIMATSDQAAMWFAAVSAQ